MGERKQAKESQMEEKFVSNMELENEFPSQEDGIHRQEDLIMNGKCMSKGSPKFFMSLCKSMLNQKSIDEVVHPSHSVLPVHHTVHQRMYRSDAHIQTLIRGQVHGEYCKNLCKTFHGRLYKYLELVRFGSTISRKAVTITIEQFVQNNSKFFLKINK